MHRLAVAVLVLIAMLGAWSQCQSGNPRDDRGRIGFVIPNLSARFFQQVALGVEESAQVHRVTIDIVDCEDSPERQHRAILGFVDQGMDAVLVAPINTKAVEPAIREARSMGIPVVAVDGRVDCPPASAFVGVDNRKASERLARRIADFVEREHGGSADIGIVGAVDSRIQEARYEAFESTMASYAGIRIVGRVDGMNLMEPALRAAQSLLSEHPKLTIIYATGEPAFRGAITAVTELNGTKPKVVGWDLHPQVARAIKEGVVLAALDQRPVEIGEHALGMVMDLISNRSRDRTHFVGVDIVTRENVE